jgi:hypothetical protein
MLACLIEVLAFNEVVLYQDEVNKLFQGWPLACLGHVKVSTLNAHHEVVDLEMFVIEPGTPLHKQCG